MEDTISEFLVELALRVVSAEHKLKALRGILPELLSEAGSPMERKVYSIAGAALTDERTLDALLEGADTDTELISLLYKLGYIVGTADAMNWVGATLSERVKRNEKPKNNEPKMDPMVR